MLVCVESLKYIIYGSVVGAALEVSEISLLVQSHLDSNLPPSVVADVLLLGLHPPMVKAHTDIEYVVLLVRFWSRSVVAFEKL